jgi:hypothetical protein
MVMVVEVKLLFENNYAAQNTFVQCGCVLKSGGVIT